MWLDHPLVLLYRIEYFDISSGIKSDKVFDPPAYCNTNSTDVDVDDGLQWYRFMYV